MRTCESAGGRRRRVRVATGLVTMLAPAALATAASGATLSVNRPCYVISGKTAPPMTVLGSGFMPGGTVNVSSSDGTASATTTAGPSGNIAVTTGAPTPSFSMPGTKTETLTAQQASGTTATTPVTSAPLAVATKPAFAALTKKVTWYFSGFRPGHFIYAHYLRRKPVARTQFGRAKGACGVLKVKARFYPGGHPRYKSYKVQIDDSKRYSKRAAPRIVTKLGTFAL